MSRSGDPSFDAYLRDIRQYPLLSAAEEHELGRVIQGDSWDAWDARDRMIRSNLRLVISVAKCYRNRGLALPDLVEEGNVGLVHAVEKFDPEMQTRFSTYAMWWIRQAVRRAILNTSKTVRIPAYMAEEIHRWRAWARTFAQEHGCSPSDDELVEALKPSLPRRRFLLRLYHQIASGSDSVSLDLLFESVEAFVDPRAERPDLIDFGSSEREQLKKAIEGLPDRERRIVNLRYALGAQEDALTLRQIAKEMGLSRERVRQLLHHALDVMRTDLGEGAKGLSHRPG